MSQHAFVLVLIAGLIHAIWNIAAKKAGGDARFACFTNLIMMVVWGPAAMYFGWQIVPQWGWLVWMLIAISGAVHVLYFVVLLRGYRKADLTVVYPLARGSGPLVSSFAALFLLNEKISTTGCLGIASVVLGVLLIAGGPRLLRQLLNSGEPEPQRKRIQKGIIYGLLTGVFIASYTLIDGYGVKVMLISPLLLYYFCNFFQIALLLPALLRDRAGSMTVWRVQWRYAVIVATISPLSYILVLEAMKTAPLSHVAPAREVSMLFAALIGGQLLGEGDRLMRVVGAVFIAAGVIALGLGS
jgi:drug/metabolite transporter (DMT)-like permease